jgi:2-oxo-4-hydroxy-4-carboxy-5-ureidoimidazoline decarboxylase
LPAEALSGLPAEALAKAGGLWERMTLAELNACDYARFVDLLGHVFEASPWVAERVWPHRPFAGVEQLDAAMTEAVGRATHDEQLRLLRAHPDLGSRIRMSEASTGEQALAGLDRLAPGELETLQRLNAAYREKFGFPFVLAVKGSTTRQILDALEQRQPRQAEDEFAEALRQVSRIARFRLDDLIR